MKTAVELNNVSFRYPNGTAILDNINVTITQGGFVGITGSNGSGKTTFSYLLNGLIPHLIEGKLTGDVSVDGLITKKNDVSLLSRHVGFVFQNPDYALFNLTVEEELLFGLKNFNVPNPNDKVIQSLKKVRMTEYLTRDPKTLSLGQKQKINLACVLSLETPIIVLDEPTAMLDFRSSLELYTTLQAINKKGTTVIVIEHDTDFLLHFTKESIIFDKGTIVSQGPTKKVFQNKKLLTTLGIKKPHFIQ